MKSLKQRHFENSRTLLQLEQFETLVRLEPESRRRQTMNMQLTQLA
jgi:hypothetical protein